MNTMDDETEASVGETAEAEAEAEADGVLAAMKAVPIEVLREGARAAVMAQRDARELHPHLRSDHDVDDAICEAVRTELLRVAEKQLKEEPVPRRLGEDAIDIRAMVREAKLGYQQPTPETPAVPSADRVRFAMRLIAEEFGELVKAAVPWLGDCELISLNPPKVASAPAGRRDEWRRRWVGGMQALELALVDLNDNDVARVDLAEVVDAMFDIDYTVEGFRIECGVRGAPIFRIGHASNMAKIGGPVNQETGKRMKPHGWTPPNFKEELIRQGWNGVAGGVERGASMSQRNRGRVGLPGAPLSTGEFFSEDIIKNGFARLRCLDGEDVVESEPTSAGVLSDDIESDLLMELEGQEQHSELSRKKEDWRVATILWPECVEIGGVCYSSRYAEPVGGDAWRSHLLEILNVDRALRGEEMAAALTPDLVSEATCACVLREPPETEWIEGRGPELLTDPIELVKTLRGAELAGVTGSLLALASDAGVAMVDASGLWRAAVDEVLVFAVRHRWPDQLGICAMFCDRLALDMPAYCAWYLNGWVSGEDDLADRRRLVTTWCGWALHNHDSKPLLRVVEALYAAGVGRGSVVAAMGVGLARAHLPAEALEPFRLDPEVLVGLCLLGNRDALP